MSRTTMSSERIAQIHAYAQDIFIGQKIEAALTNLLDLYSERVGPVKSLKSVIYTDEFRTNITTAAIKAAWASFRFGGFHVGRYGSIIQDNLWPPARRLPRNKKMALAYVTACTIGGPIAGKMAERIIAASLMEFAITMLWPTSLLYLVSSAYQVSMIAAAACLDALLVLERMFWYGGRVINKKYVMATCLYYLKLRLKVHAQLKEKISLIILNPVNMPTRTRLKALFRELAEEFWHKRKGPARGNAEEKAGMKHADSCGLMGDIPGAAGGTGEGGALGMVMAYEREFRSSYAALVAARINLAPPRAG
jgi:hypothetical protein